MQSLTWEAVSHWRLTNQHLLAPLEASQILTVAGALGGVQAQVMSAAELALSARLTGLKSADVQKALWQDRSLVKSWFMRGTLHLISAEDYPLYIAAFRTMKHYTRNSWYKYFEVTPEELAASIKAVGDILTDEGLSREALADKLVEVTNLPQLRDKLLSGWGTLLKPPSFQGLLCFAPSEGQNVRFVQPKHWLGEWEEPETEMALKEVARRFLKAYGAGTAKEFSRWFGLPDTDGKKIFKSLSDELVAVDVEGWQAMALPMMLERDIQLRGTVNLLGHFDPYTIMLAPHADNLMLAEKKGTIYRPQGWIMPVVLLDGRIVGIWEQETKGKRTSIKVELFEDKGAILKQGIEAEINCLGQFLDTELELIRLS